LSSCKRHSLAAGLGGLTTALIAQSSIASAQTGSINAKPQATVLFVSHTGAAGGTDQSCATAGYSTIQSALDAAAPRSIVVVCQGTYTEDVIVSKAVTMIGQHAVIQGSPNANGNCDQLGPQGPGSAPCLAGVTIKSSNVTIEGFKVQGAIGEGILATGSLAGGSIKSVTIEGNKVVHNNTGGIPPTPNSPYPQCAAQGQIPGDCGEAFT
jgi:pectin methylesterase-like acyl-CoA thioesterase